MARSVATQLQRLLLLLLDERGPYVVVAFKRFLNWDVLGSNSRFLKQFFCVKTAKQESSLTVLVIGNSWVPFCSLFDQIKSFKNFNI